METRTIGSLEVSVVGLGTNNFGRRIDKERTLEVIDASLEAGINFLDTSDSYGPELSESFIGELLASRRDQVVLATKFGSPYLDMPGGGKPEYVKKAAEASLRRLQTDVIDLYILHRPDPETPIGDTLEALGELVRAGKVRELGCSNFSVDQLKEAEAAVANGAPGFVNVQNYYSLLHREPEQGVLAECERQHLGFVPYFPLESGLLTGKFRRSAPIPEGTRIGNMPEDRRNQTLSEENLALVERLIEFSEQQGHSILDLAISWLLAQPAVVSVIAGATSPQQVKANAQGATWKLTADELAVVDQLLSAG